MPENVDSSAEPENERLVARREVLKSTAAATVVALSANYAQAGQDRAGAQRPNVLLFHCHDLGVFLGSYGVKTVRSPHLDAFAAQGVRFSNSFCTAPQCSPSRAALFTGRYPHNTGVMGLCHGDFAWDLKPEERHLASILAEAGYRSEAVGVIHETRSGARRCGYEQHASPARVAQAVDAAVARLEVFAANPGQPFFLSVGSIEPHRLPRGDDADYMGFLSDDFDADTTLGVEVPGFLRDTPGTRRELAELQGAVHHVDAHFGRILARLRELGLEEHTLTIFTTDHGYAMPRAKCSLYDPGLAVAFILRLPSRQGWHGGMTMPDLVSNVDCLPTILDAVGLPIPAQVQGRSIAPLLDGRSYTARDAVFGEISHHDYYDPRRCIRTARHKLIMNFSSAPFFMDPSQSWRPRSDTVVPPNHALAYHPCVELYDLEKDPWELENLAESTEHAAIRDDLMRRLREHLVSTDDPIVQGAITPPMHTQALRMLGL